MDKYSWIDLGLWGSAVVFLGKLFFWDSSKRAQIYKWVQEHYIKKDTHEEIEKKHDERYSLILNKLDSIDQKLDKR